MNDAIQDRYAPQTTCFGCGPANREGLRIKTVIENGVGVCEFHPEPHHQAFEGFVNGGIIGVVFDCHCNWTAAWFLMDRAGADVPPSTVTAKLEVRYVAPTRWDRPVVFRARVTDASDRRATVEGTAEVDGEVTAECTAVFVAVGAGHPAHGRW